MSHNLNSRGFRVYYQYLGFGGGHFGFENLKV